jgi:hypothetical protein
MIKFFGLICFLMMMATLLWPRIVLAKAEQKDMLVLNQKRIEDSTVYWVVVPENYRLRPAVSQSLQTVEGFAQQEPKAAMVINAGFFDPSNQLSTSYVLIDGQRHADPTLNPHLMNNPSLRAFLKQMLNRSTFKIADCSGRPHLEIGSYDAGLRQAPCVLTHALQAGPNLLSSEAEEKEAFIARHHGHITRDPIGVNRRNARSAVGITQEGRAVIVMVAMSPKNTAYSGLSLSQLSTVMKDLGCVQAMAFDGGSSSSMVIHGKAYYGKYNVKGQIIRRPVKSALLVLKE